MFTMPRLLPSPPPRLLLPIRRSRRSDFVDLGLTEPSEPLTEPESAPSQLHHPDTCRDAWYAKQQTICAAVGDVAKEERT